MLALYEKGEDLTDSPFILARQWMHHVYCHSKGNDPLPEDSPRTSYNFDYSVIEIDEDYNRELCYELLRNKRHSFNGLPDEPDRFYINNGEIVETDTDEVVIINPNPQKEAYKLSQLYGLTHEQLDNYIDNNVTDLPSAREFVRKMVHVVLGLVKQTKLDQ